MNTFADLELERSRIGPVGRTLLGIFLAGQMVAQLLFLLVCWPAATTPPAEGTNHTLAGYPLTREVSLILSVAVLGAMGGSTHALGSFARFTGNRQLVRSWVWWYLLRAPIGLSLAVVLYFVVRGGLLVGNVSSSSGSATDGVNPYGIGALAALAGLCSEAATRKLAEVFETLFRTDKRPDKDPVVPSGPPTIVAIDPVELTGGENDAVIVISGTALAVDDVALVNGRQVPFEHVSPTQARIMIGKGVLTAGEHEVMVCRAANPELRSTVIKLRVK
ncbi:MAG: hypothetical protein GIKADHBN_02580 [Phycisphaerales bacterium]|nr:hypothetical protein [Phycisphaerales bacterium]